MRSRAPPADAQEPPLGIRFCCGLPMAFAWEGQFELSDNAQPRARADIIIECPVSHFL